MADKYKLNPFTGRFDDVGSYNGYDGTSAPASKSDGYMSVVEIAGSGYIYFFANGSRYKVLGTLDNPSGTAGIPMGLLLSLTYAT